MNLKKVGSFACVIFYAHAVVCMDGFIKCVYASPGEEKTVFQTERWALTEKQAQKFERFTGRSLSVDEQKQHIQKLMLKKTCIQNNIEQTEKYLLKAIKKEFSISDDIWIALKTAAKKIRSFEKKHSHEPLDVQDSAISAEIASVFCRQLCKNKINPARVELRNDGCFWSCTPSIAVRRHNSEVVVDETTMLPGLIVVDEPMLHIYKLLTKPMAMFLVERMVQDDRMPGMIELSSKFFGKPFDKNNQVWLNFLSFLNKKALVSVALKSYKKACAMRQCGFLFVDEKAYEEYVLLTKIVRYWQTHAWLKEQLLGEAVPKIKSFSVHYFHRYNLVDEKLMPLKSRIKNQTLEEIKQQLNECKWTIECWKNEALENIKKRFLVSDHVWSQIRSGWELWQQYEEDNKQIPLPNVVHDLSDAQLVPLKKYLQKCGINPQRVSIDTLPGEVCIGLGWQLPFTPCKSNICKDTLTIEIIGETIPGKISVSPTVHYADVRSTVQQMVLRNDLIEAVMKAAEVFFNYTPERLSECDEWKKWRSIQTIAPWVYVALKDANAACCFRERLRKSGWCGSLEHYELMSTIHLLRSAYEIKKKNN